MSLARLAAAALLLPLTLGAHRSLAEPSIHALTRVLEGHQVGGVAIDQLGNLYVADFAESVWKISPEGVRTDFASGLYGASGNAIDAAGNLLQASFYGDSVVRIDRLGRAIPFATAGLHGPVGIAVEPHGGDVYVANCIANTIVKLGPDGRAEVFARSDLFKCPNGLAFDREQNLYVTNFRDNRVLKITADGAVSLFATVSLRGLGHLCFRQDRFFVTAYASHEVYELTLAGVATRILGNGERGSVDGAPRRARLSFPNGIACDPWRPRVYINEYVSESTAALPRRAIVRVIFLDPPH